MEHFFGVLLSQLRDHAVLISVMYVLAPLLVVRCLSGSFHQKFLKGGRYFTLSSVGLIVIGVVGSLFVATGEMYCDSATFLDRCEDGGPASLQRDASDRPLFFATVYESYRYLFVLAHFFTTPVFILGCVTALLAKLARK